MFLQQLQASLAQRDGVIGDLNGQVAAMSAQIQDLTEKTQESPAKKHVVRLSNELCLQ